MSPAGCFWSCYAAALSLGLAGCASPSQPAAGARCLLTIPRTAPAVVELGQPLRRANGQDTAPGWWIYEPAGRADLIGVWIVPAAMLSECRT